MYKLQVFATIRETYRFIGGQLSALVDYALVPVIFGTVFATLFFLSFFTQTGGKINLSGVDLDPDQIANLPQLTNLLPTSAIIVFSIAVGIANIAFYILFAVAWHRRYLLGSAVTSPREIFAWRDRHWRFLGNLIVVSFILLLVALPIMVPFVALLNPIIQSTGLDPSNTATFLAPVIILNFLINIPIALIACRLVAVFPAIAIDQTGLGIGESIKLTRGNTWRIAFAFFLGLYLPYAILGSGISFLIFSPLILKLWIGSIGLIFVAMLLQQIILYAEIAIGVSTLSVIYKKLVDNVPAASEPTGPNAA